MAAVALAGLAGCGGGHHETVSQGTDGAVIFRDSFADNHNGWLASPHTPVRGGLYVWDVPPFNASSAPDALRAKALPAGVSVSVRVDQRAGAALRMVTCRETGKDGTSQHAAYQFGIDGRQALIRLWREVGAPPKVLARKPLAIANARTVTLAGRCVPDGKGIGLTVLVDGKVAAQARDDKPLPNGQVGLHAIARADNTGHSLLTFDDFVVREVKPAAN